MASLTQPTDVLSMYGDTGILAYSADSAATAAGGTGTDTFTATFATVAGQQPIINRGMISLMLFGLNIVTVITTIDFTASDGTIIGFLRSLPASVLATAGQGLSYGPFKFFNDGTIWTASTGILSVSAKVTTTGVTKTYTARLIVGGNP